MSTRGIVGFRLYDKDYITYNHSDSYPSMLGESVAKFIRDAQAHMGLVEARVELLNLIPAKDVTDDLWWDAHRHQQSYQSLFHGCEVKGHGLTEILADGWMIDYAYYVNDSLFCEWGYIINLDTKRLEVYRGFQKKAKKLRGRYAEGHKKPKTWEGKDKGFPYYFPISLVADIPFNALPPEGKFEEAMDSILSNQDELGVKE